MDEQFGQIDTYGFGNPPFWETPTFIVQSEGTPVNNVQLAEKSRWVYCDGLVDIAN